MAKRDDSRGVFGPTGSRSSRSTSALPCSTSGRRYLADGGGVLGGEAGDHGLAPVFAFGELDALLKPRGVMSQSLEIGSGILVGRISLLQPGANERDDDNRRDGNDGECFWHGRGNSLKVEGGARVGDAREAGRGG